MLDCENNQGCQSFSMGIYQVNQIYQSFYKRPNIYIYKYGIIRHLKHFGKMHVIKSKSPFVLWTIYYHYKFILSVNWHSCPHKNIELVSLLSQKHLFQTCFPNKCDKKWKIQLFRHINVVCRKNGSYQPNRSMHEPENVRALSVFN